MKESVYNSADDSVVDRKKCFIRSLMVTSAMVIVGPTFAAGQAHTSRSDTDDDTSEEPLTLAQENSASVGESERQMDEVVVTGVRYRAKDQKTATAISMDITDTPQAMTILDTELLQEVGARNTLEALDLVVGAEVQGVGFGAEDFLVRGSSLQGNTRLNGILATTLNSPDASLLERIEVVRGPATALYGITGNFGGEVNQILKRPREEFNVGLGFEARRWDTQHYTMDATGAIPGTDGRLRARLVASYDEWSPVNLETVTVNNDQLSILGSVAYDFTPNTVGTLQYVTWDANEDPFDGGFLTQRPDGTLTDTDRVPREAWYYSDPRLSKGLTDYTGVFGRLVHDFANGWQTEQQVAWQTFDQEIHYFFPFGPAGGYYLGDDEVYLYTYDIAKADEQFTFQTSLSGDFDWLDQNHEFSAHFEYQTTLDQGEEERPREFFGLGYINIFEGGQGVLTTNFVNPGDDRIPEQFLSEAFRDALPLLGQEQSFQADIESFRGGVTTLLNPHDRIALLGGILIDDTSVVQRDLVTGQVFNQSFTETLLRASITYKLIMEKPGLVNKLNAYVNYSEGFFPNTGVTVGTGDDQVLTDAPQTMDQIEFGIKGEFFDNRFDFSAVWYSSKLENLPVSAVTAGGFGTVLEGRREVSGIEIEGKGMILPGWNVLFNYGYTDAEVFDPENFPGQVGVVRNLPEHQGALFTTYEFYRGWLRGLRLGGGLVVKGDYPLVGVISQINQFGQVEDNYSRLDLHLAYTTMKNLEIYFKVLNVTDEDWNTSFFSTPAIGINRSPKTTWVAGLRYDFGASQ